uniref:Nucleoside phosphorylase domain-containing protein n=1 Tax=Ananas comosus var. bracteatus TaxID=296719 RepID=A0A6V7PJM0_ANACO|nr:unnamed protein product [Ananas comosus var. bracteatus]
MAVRSTQPLRIQRLRSLPLTPLLLLLFRCSAGLPWTHPLRSAIDRVNGERGPFIALVMAYPAEAAAVRSSGAFVPSSLIPSVDLYGRRFHIGTIRDVDVIYVMSGQRRRNRALRTAGSANDSLSYGDVSVPKFIAYTGSWEWTKFGSTSEPSRDLMFGEYNVPTEGTNLLSAVKFKTEEFYSVGKPMEEVFWLEVNAAWFRVAEQLKVQLEICVNKTYCLPEAPKVVFGLKASTADVFVDNAAYREFLFKEFEVSTVDEESAAVIMTAMSISVPVAVFRGVSDLAGGDANWSSTALSDLASTNALKVAVEFIAAIGK